MWLCLQMIQSLHFVFLSYFIILFIFYYSTLLNSYILHHLLDFMNTFIYHHQLLIIFAEVTLMNSVSVVTLCLL